jgi:hypothetical protein
MGTPSFSSEPLRTPTDHCFCCRTAPSGVLAGPRLRYQAGRDAGARTGDLNGILFVADTNPVGASARRGDPQRVRLARSAQLTLG